MNISGVKSPVADCELSWRIAILGDGEHSCSQEPLESQKNSWDKLSKHGAWLRTLMGPCLVAEGLHTNLTLLLWMSCSRTAMAFSANCEIVCRRPTLKARSVAPRFCTAQILQRTNLPYTRSASFSDDAKSLHLSCLITRVI